MSEDIIEQMRTNILAIGRMLWEKDLVSGLNGNISARIDEEKLLLTGHKTCLGILHPKDVLLLKTDGTLLEEGQVSSERLLHTEIYKTFPKAMAVIHTHTTFTNAYFMNNDRFEPATFEAKFYLGQVTSVAQATPSVTDAGPVIETLKQNNIAVLKNHGVVAMGKDLFDCFLLIQCLEESIKTDAISRLYQRGGETIASGPEAPSSAQAGKTYELFSREQIEEIVRLVNDDARVKELGEETQMTMALAVKLEETGQVYRFSFHKGRIKDVAEDDKAEFVITAPAEIWRAVFNQEIDPFVATTQKKMTLDGDFAKISKWYAPCSRIFELWQQVPVE